MIGRSDFELVAPPLPDLSEWITLVCRRRWPQGVFLDANETELIPLASPRLSRRPPSHEFFVYDSRQTAENWEELGPCAENWNLMLHFLWDLDASGTTAPVTVVIDELTPDIQTLFDDLQDTFHEAEYFARATAEAA